MTTFTLETLYRGARLELRIEGSSCAKLLVNGILREENKFNQGSVRLSSTVQTDYEWHEYIEGRVEQNDSGLVASLLSNNTLVAEQLFPIDGQSS